MNLSAPFVARPVATTLLAIGVVLAGAVAFTQLPVSPLMISRQAMSNSRAWASSRAVILTDIWAGSEGVRLDTCELQPYGY